MGGFAQNFLLERQGECVGFVGVERHILSAPDSIKAYREARADACLCKG